jgi:hypothetical protein
VVVIVPDSGLRSALVGRLSLHGASVVTMPALPVGPALDRLAAGGATLIADVRSIDGALPVLRNDRRWGGIVVLAEQGAPTPPGERFSIVERADALDRICALVDAWRGARG